LNSFFSSAIFSNATTVICNIPSWGIQFSAQTALVSFSSMNFDAPLPASIEFAFVSSAHSLYPSMQSVYGGTIVFVLGSGFDKNVQNFNCMFLQGAFNIQTPFSVLDPGSGSCPTPFWNVAQLHNRTYEVRLIYGPKSIEMHAGIIKLE
jgi:hypothetical protein